MILAGTSFRSWTTVKSHWPPDVDAATCLSLLGARILLGLSLALLHLENPYLKGSDRWDTSILPTDPYCRWVQANGWPLQQKVTRVRFVLSLGSQLGYSVLCSFFSFVRSVTLTTPNGGKPIETPAVGVFVGTSMSVPLLCSPSSYRMFIHRSSKARMFFS